MSKALRTRRNHNLPRLLQVSPEAAAGNGLRDGALGGLTSLTAHYNLILLTFTPAALAKSRLVITTCSTRLGECSWTAATANLLTLTVVTARPANATRLAITRNPALT